ncbi:hypothetical protein B0H14DRAFT_2588140 [Mycena olivaceomarginata]|nr:hypothetical protein B0H14DRAFT_2588140 [Mycena olivaceomarginata]
MRCPKRRKRSMKALARMGHFTAPNGPPVFNPAPYFPPLQPQGAVLPALPLQKPDDVPARDVWSCFPDIHRSLPCTSNGPPMSFHPAMQYPPPLYPPPTHVLAKVQQATAVVAPPPAPQESRPALLDAVPHHADTHGLDWPMGHIRQECNAG